MENDLKLISKWILEPENSHPKIRVVNLVNNQYVISTLPTGENGFKFQTIRVPDGVYISPNMTQGGISPDMTIKVQAFFHRIDNPNSQPISFVHTYQPDFEDAGTGNWNPPPPPPPAPAFRTVNVTKQYEGGTFANQTIS
ncbi:MAG: hypothetical protein SNJ66_07415, partial [Chloroherpetonaceae bacterium]